MSKLSLWLSLVAIYSNKIELFYELSYVKPQNVTSIDLSTALYTEMAALAVFVLYTNVCRCSKKYVFFLLFRVVDFKL